MAIKELKSIKFPGLDDVYVIPEGGSNIEVDTELSNTSENPVQNKAIKEAIDTLAEQIEDAGSIDIDLAGANEGEISSVNADTLGGRSPEEYIALANNYTNQQVKKAAPRNLLDNSDFRNPVNQRGQTSYTSDPRTYTIDRWVLGSYGTMVVNNENITLISNSDVTFCDFEQNFENFDSMNGKIYTIAGKTSEGLFVNSFVMGNVPDGISLISEKLTLFSISSRHVLFRPINNTTLSFEWVALYEGEYTAETLPEYQPKGYSAELRECKRYYQKFFYNQYQTIGLGYEGPAYAFIQLSGSDMRIQYPTMTISAPVQIGSRTYTPIGCEITNGTIIIGINYDGITTNVGGCYSYCPTAGGCIIELSVDL